MSDELLRHFARNQHALRKLSYTTVTGSEGKLLGEQGLSLLAYICDRASDERMVWCSERTYSQEIGVSNRTTETLLQRFCEYGLLRFDGWEPNTRARPTKRYEVLLPGLAPYQRADAPPVAPPVALVPKGRPRPEPRTTHTGQREGQSQLDTRLRRLGSVYAEKALEEALARGEGIKSPKGWKVSVAKTVTSPAGDLYEDATRLLNSHPDTPPTELLPLLLSTEKGEAKKQEQLTPEQEAALGMAMGLLRSQGLQTALEYAQEHPLRDWLLSRPQLKRGEGAA